MYEKYLKEFITAERDALSLLADGVDASYDGVIDLLAKCEGKIVFFGIGKSGHIGKKLAATFSSTGSPSIFVHAAEARHGDFGMIEKRDVVILLSHSGGTAETTVAVENLKKIGCATVAFCRSADSDLARLCDYKMVYPFTREADRLGVAPSSSTTVQLALGDSVAFTLSALKGFTREDFYKYHPGGALGKALKGERDG